MADIPDAARRASTITGKRILYGRNATYLTVFEWERDGHQQVAWPGDGQTPPYDAAKIGLRLFNYPTGQVRLIDFDTGVRTPVHRCSHQDALFYGLSATQVEFVNQAIHMAYPGDASLHPEGTFHHSETIIGGSRVEFGFAPRGSAGHDLIAFSGRSMSLHTIHDEIVAGGKRRTFNPGALNVDVPVFQARYFRFPDYAIFEAHYPPGYRLPVHENRDEKIVYLVSGEMTVETGGETGTLKAGDVYRMETGQTFAFATDAGATLIEVDGSEAPWAYTYKTGS